MIEPENNGRDKQPGRNSKKPAYEKAGVGRKQKERTITSIRLATCHEWGSTGPHPWPCSLQLLRKQLGLRTGRDPR